MRDFAKQPRTLRESFDLILKAASNGRLIGGYFTKGDKYDAIGCLLTPKQRAEIRRKMYDDQNINDLVKHFGSENLKAMTGMTVKQAMSIVDVLDGCRAIIGFTNRIRAIRKIGKGKIGNVLFELKDE